MTDAYLRSLGFAPTAREPKTNQAQFAQAWRYQLDHLAQDGTPLFAEHPLGIDTCRLSALAAPITAQDVFAEIPLHDGRMLELAIQAFYAVHGGVGDFIAPAEAAALRPYHRLA